MTEPERRLFGQRLERLLRRRGKLHKELAEACHVSTSAVSHWIKGLNEVPSNKLPALFSFLNTDMDRLFGASEDPDYVLHEDAIEGDSLQQAVHRMRHDLKALNESVDLIGRELVRRRRDQTKQLSADLLRGVVSATQDAAEETPPAAASPPAPKPGPRQKAE